MRAARLKLHAVSLSALHAVADLVRAGGVCVLSGAGISTESGIPDYRGEDGTRRIQPMSYDEFLASSDARRRYWARAFAGWPRFCAARPNEGHRCVARLEDDGYVDDVITQNVDGLHQAAGSRAVEELHGTLSVVRCLMCEKRVSREEIQERLAEANPHLLSDGRSRRDQGAAGAILATIPELSAPQPDGDMALPDEAILDFTLVTCRRCGADALKPDVVYFGESVPKSRVARCSASVERCRSLLVLGSSLQVMSGYRFVRQARKAGTPVAVITRGATRGHAETTHHVDAPLGEALSTLRALVSTP